MNNTSTSSFIETPKWIKKIKTTINPNNFKDNKGFQYSVTLSLHHNLIKCHLERIPNIEPFIKNFNWKSINFPPKREDYQQFEMHNKSIALNILAIQDQQKRVIFTSLSTTKQDKKKKNYYY